MYDCSPLAPSDLAARLGMTRGAAPKLADRLATKKLITRRGRTDDRRCQVLTLAPAARRLLPKLAAAADLNDEEFFAPLAATERKTLRATLKKLAEAHGMQAIPTE